MSAAAISCCDARDRPQDTGLLRPLPEHRVPWSEWHLIRPDLKVNSEQKGRSEHD